MFAIQKPSSVMLGAQLIQQELLAQSGRNLSQASTAGFKSFQSKINSHQVSAAEKQPVSYAAIDSTHRNLSNGAINMTGNPFDFALRGSGYFGVKAMDGTVKYTRNGQFHLDPEGFLVNVDQLPVVDNAGTPLSLKPGDQMQVASDGLISINNEPSGRLGVFIFENESELQSLSSHYFKTDQEPIEAKNFQIVQGAIEESNVSVIEETMRLIQIQKTFEHSQKMMEEHHQAQKRAFNVNGRGL